MIHHNLKNKNKNEKKAVRFIADDQALLVSELGLVLDATPILGAPRAKVKRILALVHGPCLADPPPFCFLSFLRFFSYSAL